MYRIGIDLGGTNIVAGVVDDEFRIVATAKCKTRIPRPAEEIVVDMARMAKEAVQNAGLTMADIAYVGVGSPGTCNADTGIVEYSNNLQFEKLPLRDMLGGMLDKAVYIENDANAAALGEALAGAAKGAQSCVCITLGTGVGGGIIIDGKIYGGFNFAGAELGHTVIMVDGELCTCGRFGCWEAYASATALINQTRRAMVNHPDSAMWSIAEDLDKVNGRTAFDGMRAGDAVAADDGGGFPRLLGGQLLKIHRRHLHMQVQPVQQRAGHLRQVIGRRPLFTGTRPGGMAVITAGTGIHGTHQHH